MSAIEIIAVIAGGSVIGFLLISGLWLISDGK